MINARKVGDSLELEGELGLDRQVVIERGLMNDYVWECDWFWDDVTMEAVGISEYRMYEIDCYEVELENAD